MTLGQEAATSSGSNGSNALLAAVQWIEAVLLGSFATALAVVAVAVVGLMMLSGRINLRRGVTVIAGCFILFGAATIARGLREVAFSAATDTVFTHSTPALPTAPSYPTYPAVDPSMASALAADPYAGAAVQR